MTARWIFPTSELRINGMLQGAISAVVLGWLFRHTPAGAAAARWPWVLGFYGILASTVPWVMGNVSRDEFAVAKSIALGVVFAAPVALAATWLKASPYHLLSLGYWVLVAGWGVHFLASIVLSRRSPAPSA